MPHGVGGGTGDNGLTEVGTKKIHALVVQDVVIHKRAYEVKVPRFVDEEQIRYKTKEEETIKYVPKEKQTTFFNIKEENTIKYNVREEFTTKYKVREIECERPVAVDKPYERPVITEKEYQIATYGDIKALRGLIELVPELVQTIDKLKRKIAGMKDIKLVEEVKKVPAISYTPVEVERIVWKDIPRERCENCRRIV